MRLRNAHPVPVPSQGVVSSGLNGHKNYVDDTLASWRSHGQMNC